MTEKPARPVKVVVWDLDNTLWDGILLEAEDEAVALSKPVAHTIRALDERGVLHSVASRNEHEPAMSKLREHGLDEYFLHPHIGWGSKADSVADIASRLNLGLDSVVFVDDDPAERAEVAFRHPEVRCLTPEQAPALLTDPHLAPPQPTAESASRRRLYREEEARQAAQETHPGSREDFLATLQMTLKVQRARSRDLDRITELIARTNQLNSTGYIYSRAELEQCLASDRFDAIVAELTDRFGSYGTIGFVLSEKRAEAWQIKLVLTSCRVMSRGIGGILLQVAHHRADAAGLRLTAEYVDTGRNRPMYLALRFAGFLPAESPDVADAAESRPGDQAPVLLARDGKPDPWPTFLKVVTVEVEVEEDMP